jgi:hypothetical protein
MTLHTKKLIVEDLKIFAKKLERKYKSIKVSTSGHLDEFNCFQFSFIDEKNVVKNDPLDEDFYQ